MILWLFECGRNSAERSHFLINAFVFVKTNLGVVV